jgi:hypothetical protein
LSLNVDGRKISFRRLHKRKQSATIPSREKVRLAPNTEAHECCLFTYLVSTNRTAESLPTLSQHCYKPTPSSQRYQSVPHPSSNHSLRLKNSTGCSLRIVLAKFEDEQDVQFLRLGCSFLACCSRSMQSAGRKRYRRPRGP